MQALLEYIKKTKTSDYSDGISVYSHNNVEFGVRVNIGKNNFVIIDTDCGNFTWNESINLVKRISKPGWIETIPTVDEWDAINDNIVEINKLLKSMGGKIIDGEYWSDDVNVQGLVWYYSSDYRKVYLCDKNEKHKLCTIMRLK